MSIEFSDRTQAIWFVEIPGGDWMACVESIDGGLYRLTNRFRYYKDDKAWNSADQKRWSSFDGGSLEKAIEACRTIAAKFVELGGGKKYELIRGTGSVEQFFDEFRKLPFVHAKTYSSTEAARAAGHNV